MEEILTIQVEIKNVLEVTGKSATVRMILFEGEAKGPYFSGKILPGGVDTQREDTGLPLRLSARYILEGMDCDGKPCRIFIENQGEADSTGQVQRTVPNIITDSKCLAWMEQTALTGRITPWEKGVVIHIFKESQCTIVSETAESAE